MNKINDNDIYTTMKRTSNGSSNHENTCVHFIIISLSTYRWTAFIKIRHQQEYVAVILSNHDVLLIR